ncbi:unnamed protein product [Phyllotreta striolata]|uniref:Chitin-binding type-2 domain-containing protein n=1 Tax=Phyllotreta striolata TaxID=444603 RepID=A0A9N9TK96_PHYSR|nr:unnamed protein product [Phyllotreta striolata]
MRFNKVLLFVVIMGGTWQIGRPTCVLESDFGFVLNCAFKKSGLFRVRNLGGVKAHIGLGFSVGDELGFKESLTNVEQNRRRSTSASKLQAQLIQAQQNAKKPSAITPSPKGLSLDSRMGTVDVVTPTSAGQMMGLPKSVKRTSGAVPPFKPIPPAEERYTAGHSASFTEDAVKSRNYFAGDTNNPEMMAIIAIPRREVQAQDKTGNDQFSYKVYPAAANNEVNPKNAIISFGNSNFTEEDIEALIQKQMAMKNRATTTTTTTTTTTPKPFNKYANSAGKVMNAPKEYYPVGYDKNFDDNFASRVELPETSFYCGDQKHFPGLYADEDLGCMVFHVCALTDDGLIMKSFLCPESTLFDQTILKCNWWFYVDCKNSKKLYDSNIPISKSYQLMKALTFFSSYKNDNRNSTKTNDKD